jgi:hypothetical protein
MKSRIFISVALLAAFVLGLIMVRPIARAAEYLAAAATCTKPGACVTGKNTQGYGVFGSSGGGYGVGGQTTRPSSSAKKFGAGVIGQDLSTSGKFNVGLYGTSTNGDAILGASSKLVGVYGSSNKSTGVFGTVSGGSSPTGVYGVDNSQSGNGAGLAGQSNAGTGVIGSTLSSNVNSQAMLAAAPNGSAFLFAGVGPGNLEVVSMDNQGNVSISGQIFTNGQCGSGCARHHEAVRSYGASSASPTLEDTGEAQLIGGAASVRLDAAFYNATDPRLGYYVLITPEGDTRGLYVTHRTPTGFEVRENTGGRSNVPFAYRIVAHPFGVQAQRLPMIQTRTAAQMHAPDADALVDRQQ